MKGGYSARFATTLSGKVFLDGLPLHWYPHSKLFLPLTLQACFRVSPQRQTDERVSGFALANPESERVAQPLCNSKRL